MNRHRPKEAVKSLEVLIDGESIGVYVPPTGASFAAMVGNIPRKYMRAHIMTGTEKESWQWQLPDIQQGQTISFKMIDAPAGSGIPPQFVRARDPREVAKNKREAAKLYAKAKKEMAAKKHKKA